MAGYFKASEASAWAIHAMRLIAENSSGKSAAELAEKLGASRHTLQKILRKLARGGLLSARRGPDGGFALTRRPEDITIAEILMLVDHVTPQCQCLFPTPVCVDSTSCPFSQRLGWINSLAHRLISEMTLAEMKFAAPIKNNTIFPADKVHYVSPRPRKVRLTP